MFKNYVKIALRSLQKNKVYTLLNVTGLALSMACCILIFLVVQYHLSFDNFHPQRERIYRFVTEQHRDQISYVATVPLAFGQAFRNDYSFSEKVARIVTFDKELVSVVSGHEVRKFKEAAGVAFVEPEYFDIFNFPLLQGNKADMLSAPNTAVITESLALKYFGTVNADGKMLRINNKIDCRITGILKDLPANSDHHAGIFVSWASMKSYNEFFAASDSWGGMSSPLQCFTRLRPGVTVAEVEKVLPAYVTRYRPKSKNVHHYKLQPLSQVHFEARYGGAMEKRNLWVLSMIGVFLLVTACVNFVNLATAQALSRSREIGIRKALGSLRGQLFWQFIAETGLIALVAMLLAIIIATGMLPVINNWFHTKIVLSFMHDWMLWAFIPLLTLLVTFLSGSWPGLILSGFKPVTALKGKLSASHSSFAPRRTLIVLQFSVSLVLIIAMIVITRQIKYASHSDLGFDKDAVVMIGMGSNFYDNSKAQTLRKELAALPGVKNVSMCYAAPAAPQIWNTTVKFDTRSEEEIFKVSVKSADESFAPTFGLQLLAGRNMFAADSNNQALINETMLRRLQLSSPEEAIGRQITYDVNKVMIVGVVKDFYDRSFHEAISSVMITNQADQYTDYAVKINMKNLVKVVPELEKKWSDMYPEQLFEYQFLDESIAEFYDTESTMLKFIMTCSFIAIFIGCLGLYGLVSYMVAQKTKEIGIRKVLGSSISGILWIFGKEFAQLILIAFLLAAPLAWWLMHTWLQDFKYHIQLGPAIFALSIVIIAAVAVITVGYQSLRAALMNPVTSLKAD
ncbi:FtsX-like permease family protein [Chitinophaga sp. Mgbs1]|uniref:FtsX-like permease family protein n=1 Tax=Chitinophaga solisilvae TaxID=1233460 RepID=A0A433WD06_9BACT|nr:FtsX-like permease family protein [Chitinophaga solisilvae]